MELGNLDILVLGGEQEGSGNPGRVADTRK